MFQMRLLNSVEMSKQRIDQQLELILNGLSGQLIETDLFQ